MNQGHTYCEFEHAMMENLRDRISAIKAVAQAQKEKSRRRGTIIRRMEDITALADATMDMLDSYLVSATDPAIPSIGNIGSHDAHRFLLDICKDVRPSARVFQTRIFYKRPPTHLEITADAYLLRRALINMINVAIRNSVSGCVVVMLYEACGNSVIEATYGGKTVERPKSVEPAEEWAPALVARDRIELNIAERIAHAHQGKMVTVQRRRHPGTILRLQLPNNALLQSEPPAKDPSRYQDGDIEAGRMAAA